MFKFFLLVSLILVLIGACTKKEEDSENKNPSPTPTPANESLLKIEFSKHPKTVSALGGGSIEFAIAGGVTATYECRLNSESFLPCVSPVSISTQSEGLQSFEVKALSSSQVIIGGGSYEWSVGPSFSSSTTNTSVDYEKRIEGITIDNLGTIHLATWAGYRYSTDGGQTFTLLTTGLDLSNIRSYKVRVGGLGKVVIGTKGGLGIKAAGSNSFTMTSLYPTNNRVYDVWISSDESEILAATPNGVYYSTNGGTSFTNWQNGLPNPFVNAIFKDSQGRFLAATASGLARASSLGGAFSLISTSGISNLYDVYVEGSKIVFATTQNGLYFSPDDGVSWTQSSLSQGLRSKYVLSVFIDSGGVIYAGTTDGLSVSYSQGLTFTNYTKSNGDLPDYSVYDIAVSPLNGRIYLSTMGGIALSNEFSGALVSTDTEAPLLPTDKTVLSSQVTATSATLTWSSSTDNITSQVNLNYSVIASLTQTQFTTVQECYLNGMILADKINQTNTVTIHFDPKQSYQLCLVVEDEAGNKSLYDSLIVTAPAIEWAEVKADISPIPNIWNGELMSLSSKLFMVGGINGPVVSLTNKVYSSTDNGLNWSELTPVWDSSVASPPADDPVERMMFAGAVFNNKLWITGGVGWAITEPTSLASSSDGVNWFLEVSSPPWDKRNRMTMVTYKEKLWLLGGEHNNPAGSGPSVKFDDVYYSDDGLSWMTARVSGAASGFVPRSGHAAAVFLDRLWVIGGTDRSAYSSIDGVTWERMDSVTYPLPVEASLTDHRLAVLGGKMCLIGGSGSSGAYLTKIYCTRDGQTWQNLGDFLGREYHMTAVHNGSIFLMGGARYGYPLTLWSLF